MPIPIQIKKQKVKRVKGVRAQLRALEKAADLRAAANQTKEATIAFAKKLKEATEKARAVRQRLADRAAEAKKEEARKAKEKV